MFQLKICGVTSVDDACRAFELGADIVGLNFYQRSPRCLSVEVAKAIADHVPLAAGVFVNASADEIHHTVATVGLDWIQLHGDEPPEFLLQLDPQVPIIRAVKLGTGGLSEIVSELQACRELGRVPDAVLVDATVPGQYGGTGRTVDWDTLVDHHSQLQGVPLILAGGLHPENVAESVRIVQPAAVDTASGVESAPGVKDPTKMRVFLEEARAALEQHRK